MILRTNRFIRKIKNKIISLFSHAGFLRYAKNTSWLMIEKILRMFVGLFVGAWVARYLGPDQYGLLSYAQSFVGLFTAIATLGLDGIVVREIVKYPEKENEILGTAFVLKLIGAITTFIILYIAIHFTSNNEYTNILIFIIASAAIFQAFNVIDMYFQAKVMGKYAVIANTFSLFISSALKIILILMRAPLVAFALVVIFDSLILASGYVYCYLKVRKKFFIKQIKFEFGLAKELLKDSKFLFFSSMVLMIQARIDQVMLKSFLGNEEVGYYSVAMRLIESFGFLPMVLKNSLYPAVQNAKAISEQIYKSRLLNLYRMSFFLFLIIAIPIFSFSENIVVILFGQEYQPAGILLSLMVIRLFFANMGVGRGHFILSENLLYFSFITMVIGTTTNIVLNYLWIPFYGSMGAVFASIVSFFVTIFLVDIFYNKTRENVFIMLKAVLTFYKMRINE
ncbi:flippase [Spirochaetia bacterium 38H-sp]|uniref:Flippase n=1 Tax=Rarispira pelagica TaxID=3141764 RepID=A0ABU9UAE5_9SPIR